MLGFLCKLLTLVERMDHTERVNPLLSRIPYMPGFDPDAVLEAQPIESGISGSRLVRVTLRGNDRHVLKPVLPEEGWLGAASADTRVREAALWESGLLRALPPAIETAITTVARDAGTGEAWLVMRDVRSRLQPDPFHAPPGRHPRMITRLLRALAHLHAAFWNDARLRDPALGLMRAREALLLISPEKIDARLAAGDANPYLPLARDGWEAFFRLARPEDGQTLRGVLAKPEPWLVAIERLPVTLAHGDIWGPNLAWLPATTRAPRRGTRPLLLDWALATAGPATYDPLWLCGNWHTLDPVHVLAVYRAHLTRALYAHGIRLAPDIWRGLADAGYLRTALTCGEAFGRAATEAPPGAARARAEARLRWWAARATLAARRLAAEV